MDQTNLRALRRILVAFINADPRDIVLERRSRIPTDVGGFVWGTPISLPSQRFRLVPMKRRLTELHANTQDGNIPSLQYVLVGYYDADIETGDEFTLNGVYYRVMGLEPHADERAHTDRVVAHLEVRQGG